MPCKYGRRKAVYLVLGMVCLCCCCLILMRNVFSEFECSNGQSLQYLDELCSNYSKARVTGSFCTPLCTHKEVHFSHCVGHGVKPHVLIAEWKNARIILKVARSHRHVDGVEYVRQFLPIELSENKPFTLGLNDFILHVNNSIYYDLANYNPESISKAVERVFRECDIGGDGILYLDEMVTCWLLLETKEYSFYQLLQGNSALPELLGVCGPLYAVQYAPSEPFLGFRTDWFEVRDWKFRAQLALALLGMVEALEDTEFGTVYLCDVQESNFGVVRRTNSLVTKAIDMDISFFAQSLHAIARGEENNTCHSDDDCNFVACQVKCNRKTNHCAGVLSSNNLKTVCIKLLQPVYHRQPALLVNPPLRFANTLHTLLQDCALSESPRVNLMLLKQLQTALMSSIRNTPDIAF